MKTLTIPVINLTNVKQEGGESMARRHEEYFRCLICDIEDV
jgi:hypothetical protein